MIDDIHKQTTVELFDFKWKDIDAIVEATKPIVFDGYLLTNNASYDLEGLQTQAELVAKDFWGR